MFIKKYFSVCLLLVATAFFGLDAQKTQQQKKIDSLDQRISKMEQLLQLKNQKIRLIDKSINEKANILPVSIETEAKKKSWTDHVNLRGYVQVRYNGLVESNENLMCDQCDKSWGAGDDFFIRRARIIFFGKLNEYASFYIQPDFASSASIGTAGHLVQLRDAYFDISLDKEQQFRFRIGQSKIPYGFENLQSSQNRLPLDRHDAFNSAVTNERDLGIFFYWTPKRVQKLFTEFGSKHSGNYGMFGIGVYNGQTANFPDATTIKTLTGTTFSDGDKHFVARLTYPFKIWNQIIEPGVQAYTGYYFGSPYLDTNQSSNDKTYQDRRIGVTLAIAPKPFGLLAEYTLGKGPEFNKTKNKVTTQELEGGHITVSYQKEFKNKSILTPYYRISYFDGGKKHETNAPSYEVMEHDLGLEWQPFKAFELVASWVISDRTLSAPGVTSGGSTIWNGNQQGNLLRLQAQINF